MRWLCTSRRKATLPGCELIAPLFCVMLFWKRYGEEKKFGEYNMCYNCYNSVHFWKHSHQSYQIYFFAVARGTHPLPQRTSLRLGRAISFLLLWLPPGMAVVFVVVVFVVGLDGLWSVHVSSWWKSSSKPKGKKLLSISGSCCV